MLKKKTKEERKHNLSRKRTKASRERKKMLVSRGVDLGDDDEAKTYRD